MHKELQRVQENAMSLCAPVFHEMENISLYNMEKVLTAFRKAHLSAYHFAPTNGYGYGDPGREKLEEIWCHIFHTEAALVRPQFVSGTHALATVLLGLLKSGDTMLSAVGAPYDTMQSVIGLTGNAPGNLKERGIHYKEVPLREGTYDLKAISDAVDEHTTLVEIQRSCGYMLRHSLYPEDIQKIIQVVKEKNPKTICFVDNCYGEFTCKEEPTDVGADIIAGSLIKNAGGGLAPTGAYICGKADLVELCAHVLTAPGLGNEMGSYAGGYQSFFQGLFLAPHITRQAMMSAEFCAAVFKELGFTVTPEPGHLRTDLITAVTLKTENNMCHFAKAIQNWSPVDSDVTPLPDAMPGYVDQIIMAAGTFVQGSTIEMSADGPVRDPYVMYFQGGLVFEHAQLAIMGAAEKILEEMKR